MVVVKVTVERAVLETGFVVVELDLKKKGKIPLAFRLPYQL